VGEFARLLNMSLAAVSKHLKLLENAGLVHRTEDQPAEPWYFAI
jgi:DNA-binding transcriptional ArsR family regulator